MRYLLVLLLGLWGGGLSAMPLTFASSLYQTTAFAQAGAAIDAPPTDSNLSSPLPLLTTASAADGNDRADAGGTADVGFLGTAAELSSMLQPAAALANAEFTGDFVASGGPLLLTLNFDSQLMGSGNGLAANTLLVRLTGNGVTLLEELFSMTELITRAVALPAGPVRGTLDLLLTSSAEATGGDALGVATVSNFALAVPEPPVWALLTPDWRWSVYIDEIQPLSLVNRENLSPR